MKLIAFFVLAMTAFLVQAFRPSTEGAVTRCGDIGISSGCSGCNNPHTGCEWCTSSKDESEPPQGAPNNCVPKDWCGVLGDEWSVSKTLCPAIPYQERKLRGTQISTEDELRFSPSFDKHYCEFPKQPWTVDRFSNIFSNNDPARLCNIFNDQLFLGQRNDVEEACGVSLSNIRVQACMEKFQSFQCTTACPEYGQNVRFSRICHEDCDALVQVCNIPSLCGPGASKKRDGSQVPPPCTSTLDHCLSNLARANGGVAYSCVVTGDLKDCDSPNWIPASGQYEHDYCFFGDPKRCNGNDCQIKVSPSWGTFYANNCPCCEGDPIDGWSPIYNQNGDQVGVGGTNRSNFCESNTSHPYPAISTAPTCVHSNRQAFAAFNNWITDTEDIWLEYDRVAVAFDIVKENEGKGRDCEEVAKTALLGMAVARGNLVGPVSASCGNEFGVLKCVGTYEVEQDPLCTKDVVSNCLVPNEVNCIANSKSKVNGIDHCDEVPSFLCDTGIGGPPCCQGPPLPSITK